MSRRYSDRASCKSIIGTESWHGRSSSNDEISRRIDYFLDSPTFTESAMDTAPSGKPIHVELALRASERGEASTGGMSEGLIPPALRTPPRPSAFQYPRHSLRSSESVETVGTSIVEARSIMHDDPFTIATKVNERQGRARTEPMTFDQSFRFRARRESFFNDIISSLDNSHLRTGASSAKGDHGSHRLSGVQSGNPTPDNVTGPKAKDKADSKDVKVERTQVFDIGWGELHRETDSCTANGATSCACQTSAPHQVLPSRDQSHIHPDFRTKEIPLQRRLQYGRLCSCAASASTVDAESSRSRTFLMSGGHSSAQRSSWTSGSWNPSLSRSLSLSTAQSLKDECLERDRPKERNSSGLQYAKIDALDHQNLDAAGTKNKKSNIMLPPPAGRCNSCGQMLQSDQDRDGSVKTDSIFGETNAPLRSDARSQSLPFQLQPSIAFHKPISQGPSGPCSQIGLQGIGTEQGDKMSSSSDGRGAQSRLSRSKVYSQDSVTRRNTLSGRPSVEPQDGNRTYERAQAMLLCQRPPQAVEPTPAPHVREQYIRAFPDEHLSETSSAKLAQFFGEEYLDPSNSRHGVVNAEREKCVTKLAGTRRKRLSDIGYGFRKRMRRILG